MNVCIYSHRRTRTHKRKITHTQTHAQTQKHTHKLTHTHTNLLTHTQTHTHMHTHTNTHNLTGVGNHRSPSQMKFLTPAEGWHDKNGNVQIRNYQDIEIHVTVYIHIHATVTSSLLQFLNLKTLFQKSTMSRT